MKYILTLIIIFSSFSHAKKFIPLILEGEDLPVCQQVIGHYKDIYKSNETTTKGITTSAEIYIPEFTTHELPEEKFIQKANITIDGKEKTLVFFSRWLGWRGQIHTGYMINPDDDLSSLTKELEENDSNKKTPFFYPMGQLKYGSDFSWWINLPFKFQDNWYTLEDFGDFQRHKAIRNVYQLHADSTSSKVCSLQIYKNFEDEKQTELPYFSAYIHSVKKILLSPGDCGTSTPESYAKSNGELFVSTALLRPWAIANNLQKTSRTDLKKQLSKHFDHWKYTDIWTYRESESFDYLAIDATSELKDYYITQFAYPPQYAEQLAKTFIQEIPFSYYSLGVYEDADKDYSWLQKMVDGQFNNWLEIEDLTKLQHGKIADIAFSLMLDNPQQFTANPTLPIDKIENYYKKNLLMYAVHMNNYDTVEWLLKNDFPLNRKTFLEHSMCTVYPERINRSALTYAAENSSIHLIKLLIDAGEKPDIIDNKGNNLDFYLKQNPRFTDEEKQLGIEGLVDKYKDAVIQPSFNCNQKLGKIESTICNNKGLSIYDKELNKL